MDDKRSAFPIYIQRGMIKPEDIQRIEETTGRVVVQLYAEPINKIMDSLADSSKNLREWFAGMALQGILSNSNIVIGLFESHSSRAFAYADAMIAEREKSGQ